MITVVGTPTPIVGAQGQYVTATVRFQSDTPLTGKVLKMNPGLFTVNTETQNGSWAYTLAYPPSAGTYAMSFTAPAAWKNGRADLEVIDAQNFRIRLYFFLTTQIGYVGDPVSPGLPFNGGQVYGGTSTVSILLEINGATGYGAVPVSALDFGTVATIAVDYSDGIQVNVTAPKGTGSEAFIGLYRVSDLAGVQYAELGFGITPVDNLPDTCFLSGTTFITSGDIAKAKFKIDPACLLDGVEYRAYVIYYSDRWRSVRTGTLQPGQAKPVITGTVSYSITDGVSTYTTGCLTDVPPCKSYSATVKMDKASYETALAGAGFTGTIETRFKAVKLTVQESLGDTQTGSAYPVQVTSLADGIQATAAFQAPPGNNYLVFGFQFDFSGQLDTVLVPVQFSAVDYVPLLGPEELCLENPDPIRVPLPEAPGTIYGSMYDNPGQFVPVSGVTIDGDTLEIDPTTLPSGTGRCYELCSEVAVPVDQPCVCLCFCANLTLTIFLANPNGIYTYLANLGFPINSTNLRDFTLEVSGDNGDAQLNGTELRGTGTTLDGKVYIKGSFRIEGGCNYTIPTQSYQLDMGRNPNREQEDGIVRELQLCQADCDCEEVPPPAPDCDNAIAISSSCATGELVFSFAEDFTSAVATDVIECSVDGGAFGACAASYAAGQRVTARRTVTFSDDCPQITAIHNGYCEPVLNCLNSATLAIDKTDTLLTLTLAGDYSSAPATETIYYSVNGGIAYQEYTAPVTLTGNENIRAYAAVTFADGCPDVVTQTLSAGGVAAGSTEPLVTYCNSAGDVTGFAVLSGSAPNLQTLYFDADMVQIQTVPDGSPCEVYEPCATCP